MWAVSFNSGHTPIQKQRGFTIVELLIVVVVIAILAAITIVAYNGIQNRAKNSALQQSVSQANKKVASYAVLNAEQYPDDLATVGIVNGDTTYQYRFNNTATPKSFCITATNGTLSYYISSLDGSPKTGACPGHGSGGATTITNLIPYTTFVTGSFPAGSSGVSASSGNGQVSANTTPAMGGPTDGSFYRRTYSAATTTFSSTSDIITMGGTYPGGGVIDVTPGQVLSLSSYVRSSKAQVVRPQLQFLTSGGTSTGPVSGTATTLVPNAWTRISVTNVTVPANATSVRVDLDAGAGAVQWAVGDTIDYTMVMLTTGSTLYVFADGDSTGWAWTGTPNASTSTGTPL